MDIGSEVFDLCMRPLETSTLERHRRALIPYASGKVLELGAGTGVNLRYYDFSRVSELHLSDPEVRESLLRRAGIAGEQSRPSNPEFVLDTGHRDRVRIHEVGVENLPFADSFFDSVVFTLVFCMVKNPLAGLREIRRVLKPTGRAYFIEHVVSENHLLRQGMNFINRPWRVLTGGCNINRDTAAAIREAGFEIDDFRSSAKGLFISGIASIQVA